MRKLFASILGLLLLGQFALQAQIYDPVKWKVDLEQVEDKYVLIFQADIEDGWKVYTNDIEDGGPIPTDIIYLDQEGYELVGELEQLGKIEGPVYEELFDMDLKWFKKKAIIRQQIKLTSESANLIGYLEYMTCDDSKCLPPTEVEFEFALGKPSSTSSTDESVETEDPTLSEDPVENDEILESDEERENRSLWGWLLLGLGGGLFALLTPCVFPMIPLTVSFFTKRSQTRKKGLVNALIYSLSIVVIFVGLGFLITLIAGPNALNAMASNAFFNIAFFIIFIVFAVSFFGAFEITLPSRWVNSADAASDKGGLIGIFFMAFTLVLVSFSCTAPIIGSILVLISSSGEFWAPLMGMVGFSLALAIPFAMFAAFPGWLNSIPKSGGWLNTVKVSLGFIELALAFKFFSVADLAYHWNILTRDIFIAIWIIIAIMWGAYLLGKLKFKYEMDEPKLSVSRLFFALGAFAFAIYLIPGMWGAPLNLVSGIAPPQHYQEFSLYKTEFKLKKIENQLAKLAEEYGGEESPDNVEEAPETVLTSMHCPHELTCYFDYDQGLEIARETNKPVLIDFTGWSCVNCRKMEDNVWSKPEIWNMLNDNYVLISLYVDDKTKLGDGKTISKYTGNKVRTIGKLWSDFQIEKYDINAQPYYVLLDADENKLVKPRGYTPNSGEYFDFLKKGLDKFKNETSSTQAKLD